MYRRILPLLILGNFYAISADYVVQTDWSGGPGVLEPVIELGNEYFCDICVDWMCVSGGIALNLCGAHSVDSDYHRASSAYSEDIDGDSYMDVLGAAFYDYDIVWWNLQEYSSEGSLESSILDTQGDADWYYIDWNATTPLNTSVSFQVRASDDYSIMGAWSDTLTSACLLTGLLNDGDRFVQYRAILNTSDPDTTSILNDITILWDPLGIGDDQDMSGVDWLDVHEDRDNIVLIDECRLNCAGQDITKQTVAHFSHLMNGITQRNSSQNTQQEYAGT